MCVYGRNVQLAYQMRETRLAKATVAQLQRQLADEQRSQIEMQLNDELFTAMTRLTDKVINQCLFHTSFFLGGGPSPQKNLQFPRPKRLPICVLENFFFGRGNEFCKYITEIFFDWTINTGNYSIVA